ncbi:MAG: hypothetical protein C0598_05010 [Marinilabiliales bacterium]|nr:MAG: hypothetical protein C0598_05010 [Marinilabiliales bacterium]
MAQKGPMPNFETMEDYIASQSEDAQKVLKELRSLIKEVIPEAEEILNYKIPCFNIIPGGKIEQQIMMAAYAKFIGFYPFPSTIKKFSHELKEYKKGKGSVQFPLNKPLPKELIKRMLKFRKSEIIKQI